MRIGVSLLVCNVAAQPLHFHASTWALDSLMDSDLQSHEWRVVVADNGSDCPRTKEWLAALPGRDRRLSTLTLPTNQGIAKGRNASYRELLANGACDALLDVHNDHIFPREWIGPLIGHMEQEPKLGLTSCGLITGGGQWMTPAIRDAYLRPYDVTRARLEAHAKSTRNQHVRVGLQHPVLKRVAMLDEIGMYDADFPGKTNFEDLDECFRAHRAGWLYWVVLASRVFHYYHLTRLELSDCMGDYAVNRTYMDQKWGPAWTDWEREIFSPAIGAIYR